MRALKAVASWPVGAAAAAVVTMDGPRGSSVPVPDAVGRGCVVAGAVGDVDRVHPWASVTKVCTSLAVLVAMEEGTLALDDPAGPPGATVAHLLAHASGLTLDGGRVLARPGRRRIYSNAGFVLLGELVAARSGLPFDVYLREAVLEPVGMLRAFLRPGASPAAGMAGSVRDLEALAAELLWPTIIAPETLRRATGVAFPGLPGVLPGFGQQDPCDWGLGFELRDAKQPHWTGYTNSPETFGHFGQSGSFLWVDPVAGVACASLADRPFGQWATVAWPALADAVLSEVAARGEAGVPGTPPSLPGTPPSLPGTPPARPAPAAYGVEDPGEVRRGHSPG